MNRVYLRGCEKAYLGSLVDTDAYCPKAKRKEGAGSLVVHIRSGDIFDPEGEGSRRDGFGQVGTGWSSVPRRRLRPDLCFLAHVVKKSKPSFVLVPGSSR